MLNTDPILTKIIIQAIPAEDCPVKNANAMHRRELLEKRLIAYLDEKLNNEPIVKDQH